MKGSQGSRNRVKLNTPYQTGEQEKVSTGPEESELSFYPSHGDLGINFLQLQAAHPHLKNEGFLVPWGPACLSVAGADVGLYPIL